MRRARNSKGDPMAALVKLRAAHEILANRYDIDCSRVARDRTFQSQTQSLLEFLFLGPL